MFVQFENIKIFRIKIDWNCNFVGLLHPRGDVGVEYVLSTPLRVVRGD